MRCRQYGLLILTAFIGGILGGAISVKYLSGEIAFAQNDPALIRLEQVYAKKIITEAFFLQEPKTDNPLDGEISIPRLALTTEPDGNPKLIMQDKNGKSRLWFRLHEENGVSIDLFDESENIRAQMAVNRDGNPILSLNDPPDTSGHSGRQIRLSLEGKDTAKMTFKGIQSDERAELYVDSENTCLTFIDLKGKTRIELGNTELSFGRNGLLERYSKGELAIEKRPISSLVLYDEAEKVLWTAP